MSFIRRWYRSIVRSLTAQLTLQVRSLCMGAPCSSEHCAQAIGQQVCAEEVVVERPSKAPALAGCAGCQCWHRNSTSASKIWTNFDCTFRKREQPSLPSLCWQPAGGQQPLSLAVPPLAVPPPTDDHLPQFADSPLPPPPILPLPAVFFSEATHCESDQAPPRAWAVDTPEPLASCLSSPSAQDGLGGGRAVGGGRQGFCGETIDGEAGDCYEGDKGMWRVNSRGSGRVDGINNLEDCVARCRCCPRCRHISFSQSPAHLDCSWYATCPTVNVPPADGRDYVTLTLERSEIEQQRCGAWPSRAA